MTTPLDDHAIKTNAEGPKKASGDSGSVEQHPLGEQVPHTSGTKRAPSRESLAALGLGGIGH